ncbi:MAG TPA: arginine repressor [Candidatus Limnocylindrales bacterium]|nr:arginine repressor [Candidatus Limnocylindrales bacterium]
MEVIKGLRQQAIRELLGRRRIRTQQELAAALRERGFRVTQATISRDVAELGLIKVQRGGTLVYALPRHADEVEVTAAQRLAELLDDLPFEVHEAGLLLVVKTVPGSAHALANALDRAHWTEPVGSIAGDDTVFLAFRDRASLRRVRDRLSRITSR